MPVQPNKLIEKAKNKFNAACLGLKICAIGYSKQSKHQTQDDSACYERKKTDQTFYLSRTPKHRQSVNVFYYANQNSDEEFSSNCNLRKQSGKTDLKQTRQRSYNFSNRRKTSTFYENNTNNFEQSSFDLGKFPLLIATPEKTKAKVTSTIIQNDNSDAKWPSFSKILSLDTAISEESSFTFNEYENSDPAEEDDLKAYSNFMYNSPCTIRRNKMHSSSSESVVSSSCFTNSEKSSSSSSSNNEAEGLGKTDENLTQILIESVGFQTKDFQTANKKVFDEDFWFNKDSKQLRKSSKNTQNMIKNSVMISSLDEKEKIFICCISYEAKSPHELSIEFTDRLKMIQQIKGYDYCLVQNVSTKKYGYVPKHCVSELGKFLKDVKYLTKKF
jgi:hypothetical protein